MQHNTRYTIVFAAVISIICSIFVAAAAVGLKTRQDENRLLDRQKIILQMVELMPRGASWPKTKIQQTYNKHIIPKLVSLQTGQYDTQTNAATFDPAAGC